MLPYFHVESRDSQIWKPPISTGLATQVIAAGERYTKLLSFVNVSMFRCSLERQVTWASRLSFDKEKQLKVAMNGFGMTDEAGLRVAPHMSLHISTVSSIYIYIICHHLSDLSRPLEQCQ